MGPLYAGRLRQLGLAAAVDEVLHGTSDTPQVLIDELTLCGDAAAARQKTHRWYDAGAEMPIVTLPPNQSVEQLDVILDGLAPTRMSAESARYNLAFGPS